MWRKWRLELKIDSGNVAFPIYLSIIWKILYTQQENVAELGFLKHANTLLRKMWHQNVASHSFSRKGWSPNYARERGAFRTTLSGGLFPNYAWRDVFRTTFRRMFSGLHLATDVFRTVSRKTTSSIILLLSFGAFRKLELKLKVKVVSYFQEEAITVIG